MTCFSLVSLSPASFLISRTPLHFPWFYIFFPFLWDILSGSPWHFLFSHTTQSFAQASLDSRAWRVRLFQGFAFQVMFVMSEHLPLSQWVARVMSTVWVRKTHLSQFRVCWCPYPIISIYLFWQNRLHYTGSSF